MNLDYIESYLQEHKCTADVELVGSRCEDECRNGPNLVINGRAYHGVTREILADLMEQLVGKKSAEPMAEVPEELTASRRQQGKDSGNEEISLFDTHKRFSGGLGHWECHVILHFGNLC